MKYNLRNIIIIVCMVFVLLIILQIIQNSGDQSDPSQIQTQENVAMPPSENKNKEAPIPVPIMPITSYNDKTKEEILEIRREYVKNSIFKNTEYIPSEYVFGQIEDNKRWISTNICKEDGHSIVEGESEESRFINNPSILVAFDFPFNFDTLPEGMECNNYRNNLLPTEAQYNENEKLLTVKFEDLIFDTPQGTDYFYQLKTINAVDFGYKYAYIDKTKSDFDEYLYFVEESNISTQITELGDFLHLGNSCGIEEGCNNGSPSQSMLQFRLYPYENRPNRDTVIYIKFWKDYPESYESPPDFIEKIIIVPDVE